MKTTLRQSGPANDRLDAGRVRASGEPVLRSTWVLLAMAVLAMAAPAASDAEPLPTCKAVCQRFTDCKMSSYTKKCLDACKQSGAEASEEGRAQLLTGTRSSCKQLQQIASAVQSAVDQHQRSSTRGAGAPARNATRQPQGSAESCSSVCGRASQCGVMQFDRCSKMCSGAAADGHHWRLGGASCSEVRNAFVNDKWSCWAEASVGTAVGNMPYNYGTTSLMGAGNTRAEAAHDAVKLCNKFVGLDETIAWSGGESVHAGSCEVTRCLPPGSPL